MPRSNDDVAVPAFCTPEIVKPADVVGVELLIPIVAAEIPDPDDDAKAIGVDNVSPYALSVSVRVAQPVPPPDVAAPTARASTSEKETVENMNCGFDGLFTNVTFGDNVIALSHAAVT